MLSRRGIIAKVQAGENVGTEENIFIPMTTEQAKARRASFLSGLKMNMFKLETRARYGGM